MFVPAAAAEEDENEEETTDPIGLLVVEGAFFKPPLEEVFDRTNKRER
jgi:hypothetical protein